MSHKFSRLSAVCKVLFDTELITLRKENEELRLSVFWKKYSAKKLLSAIKNGNKIMPAIPRNCSCEPCFEANRFCFEGCIQWEETQDPNEICAWRPLFEAKLVELGIGFSKKPDTEATIRCESDTGIKIDVVQDCDTHIVNLHGDDPERCNWFDIAYGSKLFEATTVNDPELKKLVALFEWLVPQL